jgi:hypothetical protein
MIVIEHACYTIWILCGVMVSMFESSVVDCEFEPWSGQTTAYKIGICCFSTKHATLRSKNKDWLVVS